jgi:glutamate-1-semialdehyde 2,1-aminomutase
MGLVPPAPGFLEGLRAACDQAGALLIFDEVITGFRVAFGGAAEVFGVQPDLWCFGKVIGGGLPLAAFGGRRDVMEQLAPSGPVYQAGTLSGNPLATAAGLAVLSLLDRAAYTELAARVGRLAAGLAGAMADDIQVVGAGPLLGVFFGVEPVRDYEGAARSAATGRYPALMHGLLERGVAIAPGAYEVLFPSLAHTDADLELTVQAASGTSRAMAATAR